jgi:hypothetical protein
MTMVMTLNGCSEDGRGLLHHLFIAEMASLHHHGANDTYVTKLAEWLFLSIGRYK